MSENREFHASSSSSFAVTVQMVRLCISSFPEKIQESARSFPGKQTSVTKNNLTEIRLISKTRLGFSPSTTYFSWLLCCSVNWEELAKDCSKSLKLSSLRASSLGHSGGRAGMKRKGSLQLRLWELNSTSNSPVAPHRLNCQISAKQRDYKQTLKNTW